MNPLELVGWWVAGTFGAHSLHLLSGCLIAGPAEVRRQVSESWDGPIGYALCVVTLHLYTRGINTEAQ